MSSITIILSLLLLDILSDIPDKGLHYAYVDAYNGQMFNFTALPPLSLYVHIPWCVRKCPYCDFNSHTSSNALPEKQYLASLFSDLEHDLPEVWGRPVQSIFIGGGTPSLFSAEAIDELIAGLRMRLALEPMAEITLEANPGAIDAGKFAEFKDAGINRLSIGCQSFNNDYLEKLGRIHNAKEAISAVESAHTAGFDNVNLDLMFGLPGQTLHTAKTDIEQAIALSPSHISHYQLTIEPNTLFHHSPPVLPEAESSWAIQEQCENLLTESGYGHYEISAHAKPGKQCLHNLNYWQFGDYLGIGAGAHAKISSAASQNITRSWKHKHPDKYLAAKEMKDHISGSSILSRHDAAFEFMMNALRLKQGFSKTLFSERSGLAIQQISKALEKAEQLKLISHDVTNIHATEHGWHFLNDLIALFLKEES